MPAEPLPTNSATGTPSPVSIINMLRSTQQHHIMLSSMADQKASFLVGASVVTLTLVLSQWAKGDAIVPLLSLGIGSLVSAIFASLALMPRTQPAKSSGLAFNPLFFGHFTEIPEEEYVKVMGGIIEQDRTVYEAMARDIHQMGMVLRHKKFFYLGWGYRCFVLTLVVTLIIALLHLR